MSLVTAQGRTARREREEVVTEVAERLARYLDSGAERSVEEILDALSEKDDRLVREAMWLLIDEKRARITSGRRVQRVDGR